MTEKLRINLNLLHISLHSPSRENLYLHHLSYIQILKQEHKLETILFIINLLVVEGKVRFG
jgi:hypothetical protein